MAEAVYPVLAPPHVRGMALQIYFGPTGGGGLAVYHVLPCNKIYYDDLADAMEELGFGILHPQLKPRPSAANFGFPSLGGGLGATG
jgi:hypothetical protein